MQEDEVVERFRARAEQARRTVEGAENRLARTRVGVVNNTTGHVRPNRAQEVAARQVEIDELKRFAADRDEDLKHAVADQERRDEIRVLVAQERRDLAELDQKLVKARAEVERLSGERERQVAAIKQLEDSASKTEAELDAAGVTAVAA